MKGLGQANNDITTGNASVQDERQIKLVSYLAFSNFFLSSFINRLSSTFFFSTPRFFHDSATHKKPQTQWRLPQPTELCCRLGWGLNISKPSPHTTPAIQEVPSTHSCESKWSSSRKLSPEFSWKLKPRTCKTIRGQQEWQGKKAAIQGW